MRRTIWSFSWMAAVTACLTLPGTAAAALVGLWEFEDPSNLTAATIGADLVATGSPTAASGSGGVDAGAASLDLGKFFTVTNPIGQNGGNTVGETNEFTLVMDINTTHTGWNALADMNKSTGDGDLFIRPSGAIGFASYGGGPVNDGNWYRLAFSFNLDAGTMSSFIDGAFAEISNTFVSEARHALQGTFTVFNDHGTGNEEGPINVSNLALFDTPLTLGEVIALGPAGTRIPEPGTMALGLVALLSLGSVASSSRRRR